MTKKLAIAISGAVSLGSFEAGVIYEVLEAIARHNENDQSQGNQIEIDIITGASAGGMTACILSHSLLFDGEALRKPYENPLYKAWVKEVDIVNLLQFKNNRDDQKRALLNVEKIEEVGKIYLPDKENTKGQKHLAVSSEIQIGIAMSNLNGFTYGIDTNQASIEYTRFKDRYICSVSREEDEEKGATAILREKELGLDGWEENPKPATWSMLRDVGIASGAFPFAFPLRPIFRKGLGKFWTRDSNIKAHKAPDSVHEGNYLYTD
ncbi:MAG: patatin-like phospholipase family protein, partial [Cyanobacteria bacterium P01_H01_bin.15]